MSITYLTYQDTIGYPCREVYSSFFTGIITDGVGGYLVTVPATGSFVIRKATAFNYPASTEWNTIPRKYMDYAIEVAGADVEAGLSLEITCYPDGVFGYDYDTLSLVNSQAGTPKYMNVIHNYELPPMAVRFTVINNTAADFTLRGTITVRG